MPIGIFPIAVIVRMDGNAVFSYQLFRRQINTRVLKQAGNKRGFRVPVTPIVETPFPFRIGFFPDKCKATIKLFVYFMNLLGTEQISPDQEPENFKKLDLRFGKAIVFLCYNVSLSAAVCRIRAQCSLNVHADVFTGICGPDRR